LTRHERLSEVVALGGPYLYVVSRTGVTGKDASLSSAAAPMLRRIRRIGGIPTLLGFGISRPKQVRAAIMAGASGAISGSAGVEIIAGHARGAGELSSSRRRALVEDVRCFVAEMKEATRI
jgi:tryptophan synthase alpha chain